MATDPFPFWQTVASGTVSVVLGAIIVASGGYLLWPFRWRAQGQQIRKFIDRDREFIFMFSVDPEQIKVVTFKADGTIGQGQNENEYLWRVRHGALEILGQDRELYSRFRFERGHNDVLKRTNDPELRSKPSQALRPKPVRVSGDVT